MVLFVVGFNQFLQVGREDDMISEPQKLSFSSSVIASSWSSALFLNEDGSLTLSGFCNGKSNQTRTFNNSEVSSTKSCHLTNEKLLHINSEGNLNVFDVGSGRWNDELKTESPQNWKYIDGFSSYKDASFLALTEKGEVYQLDEKLTPTWIPMLMKITQISCGFSHGMALAENGTVYTWGNGSRGQLGHGSLQDEKKPKLVEILCGVKIVSISAGGWHSIALADTGDLYVWGWNESGQLGFPTVKDFHTCSSEEYNSESKSVAMLSSPTLLELEPHVNCDDFIAIKDLSCGTRHTAVVTRSGMALTWGWPKYGQLGRDCCCGCTEESGDRTKYGGDSKRRKVESCIPSSFLCKGKPHLPGFVEYFKRRKMRVTSVTCGAWNTFFTVDDFLEMK